MYWRNLHATHHCAGSSLKEAGYGISVSDPVYVVDPAPKPKSPAKGGVKIKPEEIGEDFQQVCSFYVTHCALLRLLSKKSWVSLKLEHSWLATCISCNVTQFLTKE